MFSASTLAHARFRLEIHRRFRTPNAKRKVFDNKLRAVPTLAHTLRDYILS